MKRTGLFLVLTLSAFLTVARAESIPIGVLSFDVLIPGTPGVNQFTISNLTGVSSLPPDFPVSTGLSFLGASLTLLGPSPQTFFLGDLGPGSFSFPSLQFPSTMNFTGAIFTATLSQTTFLLVNGTTFVAASPAISLSLLPSSGSTLVAGRDFGVVSVSPVPEVGSLILVASGLALVLGSKAMKLKMSK